MTYADPTIPGFAPLEPRRYSAFTALVLAPFFVGELSRDVARRWRGIGFWFLVLQLIITWLVVLGSVQLGFNRFVRDELPKIAKTIPPVTIKDGVASSPVEQPYVIEDPETHRPLFVLDTTGQINSLKDTEAVVLLTATDVHVREEGKNQVRTQSLKHVKSFYIDKQKVLNWADVARKWLIPICLPLLLVLSLIWRLIMGVIYALIGLSFNSMSNARLDFAALMRLSALAVWPMLVLETISWVAPIPGGCIWTLAMIAVVLIYLGVAVKANALPPGTYGSIYGSPMMAPPMGYPPMPHGQSPFPQAPPRTPPFPPAR